LISLIHAECEDTRYASHFANTNKISYS